MSTWKLPGATEMFYLEREVLHFQLVQCIACKWNQNSKIDHRKRSLNEFWKRYSLSQKVVFYHLGVELLKPQKQRGYVLNLLILLVKPTQSKQMKKYCENSLWTQKLKEIRPVNFNFVYPINNLKVIFYNRREQSDSKRK